MSDTVATRTTSDYRAELKPIWCPGCGDHGVVNSVVKAYVKLNLDPAKLVMVSGIGCSSRLPLFIASYGLHGVHGRTLPTATGIKAARPDLCVVAVGGDGDAYSIGAGHLPHACRRNPDITYIVMNNSIYGLTKGQVSPTSSLHFITKSSPEGSIENPINPLEMAITYGATFIARGFSGKPNDLAELIAAAIEHKGFAWIDVISPCVTFNKQDTFDAYKEKVVPLPEDHDVSDRVQAFERAASTNPIYLGLLLQVRKPTFEEALAERAERGLARGDTLDDLFDRYV
ncbi:MAG: hypothetical protein AMXMBFR61_09900 [Fimbriimonadales bacterium]